MELDRDAIVERDKRYVWHPYTAMDAYAASDPLVIARAHGARLFDVNGASYLDGNSSWWVSSLGHGHPRLLATLERQAHELDHCSLAGTTHAPAALLAEELVALAPIGLTRVFYTDNGSGAVEVAVKMCVQMWRQLGAPNKTRFVALDGAFHGDTIGASSLGGVEVFRRPFAGVLFDCVHAPWPDTAPSTPDDRASRPRPARPTHPAEGGGYERAFAAMSELLTRQKDEIAAVFVEPLVQGAAGMRMYPPRYLQDLRALCDRCDVLLVVDEVFTGYGRTGRMWAVEHAGVAPDIMCIGKAFASIVPMAATLVTDRVFDAFRGGKEHALYYGHTFCGSPLGAALAREVLAIYKDEQLVARAQRLGRRIEAAFARIGALPGVDRVRALGMIGAADLAPDARGAAGGSGYLGERGWRVYRAALERGAYLRPLGDTVYVCPPLTIDERELDQLLEILEASIRATT